MKITNRGSGGGCEICPTLASEPFGWTHVETARAYSMQLPCMPHMVTAKLIETTTYELLLA